MKLDFFRSDITTKEDKHIINSSKDTRLLITNILHQLGVSSNLKGYLYIRDVIELIIFAGGKIKPITKELYPYIAINYNTTIRRVDRDIGYAIESAYSKGNISLFDELFGTSIDFNKSRPANLLFISTVADWILISGGCV